MRDWSPLSGTRFTAWLLLYLLIGAAAIPIGWLAAHLVGLGPPRVELGVTIAFFLAASVFCARAHRDAWLATLGPFIGFAAHAAWLFTAPGALLILFLILISLLLPSIAAGLSLYLLRTIWMRPPHLCPKCGYDLTGLSKSPCPECGNATGGAPPCHRSLP